MTTGQVVVLSLLFVGNILVTLWRDREHAKELRYYRDERAKLTAAFLSHTSTPIVAATYQTYQPEPKPGFVVEEPEAVEKPVGL